MMDWTDRHCRYLHRQISTQTLLYTEMVTAPALVHGDAEMDASTGAEITVKCRIGVDEQDPHVVLPAFVETVAARGIKSFAIHARKAWLDGLSPKQNRDVPPLDYDLVHQIKRDRPDLEIVINGGLQTFAEAKAQIDTGLDGAMIGRVAYHNPMEILAHADALFGVHTPVKTAPDVIREMLPYIQKHLDRGGRVNQITRPMLGMFAGQTGARIWKRTLSEQAHIKGAGVEVVETALNATLELQRSAQTV